MTAPPSACWGWGMLKQLHARSGECLENVVFKSLVWSGLLTLRAMDRDWDRSTITIKGQKTVPDRSRLVFCGLLRSFIIFWINIFTYMLPSFNISYRTLKSVEKWVNYNIITQVYNFNWKFPRFHKYFNNFLRCWSIFTFLDSFWRENLPLYIYWEKPVLISLNQFIWTGLFPVFNSQKSKDWTGTKIGLRSSPVQLWSFCSPRTGLSNTRKMPVQQFPGHQNAGKLIRRKVKNNKKAGC